MKTLVVYYSRKGYTEKIAMEKVRSLDCDFLAIDTIENVAGYNGAINCVKSALIRKETELFPYETNIADYEKVIICTPVWFGEAATPIKTFAKREKHNISDAEYIIVHALPSSVSSVAKYLDKTLRLENSKYTSVQCVFGKIKKEEEFSDG